MEIPSSDEITAQRSLDFQTWTSLISKVELIHHDDIDKICLVYDSFLSEFPLCYGYWKKYAEHKARLCGIENAIQVFEKAVELAPYSVDVWVEYCNFGVSSFEDPNDICRLFDKGLLLVGKDYLCYKIWDKYIEFEFSQQHWNSLAKIYIQTLKFPTKKLRQYYESFKKLVAIWEEEMRCQGIPFTNMLSENEIISNTKKPKDAEISRAINDLLDSSTRSQALSKYSHIGEHFYKKSCDLEGKIKEFEHNIHRPYFHVKTLDENQLKNWHRYLNFAELEGDFDWVMKLYERCLICCANYPEFWMRYVDYLESKGAREIASDALERATHIFLKNDPQIHLFNAWFKEEVGDVDGLRAAFEQCDQHYESYIIEYVRRKANMERRLGNYTAASNIYKEALDLATKNRPDTLPMLYLHFARLQLMITNNVDAVREVLLSGIRHLPRSKLLLEELILFAFMHEGAMQVETLDSIMAKALTFESETSDSLTAKECEDISRLYLEFIDFFGSIHDVRRAWNRHLKLFPHLARLNYSLRNPSKASTFLKMINNDGEQHTLQCLPEDSTENHVENHLKEKVPDEPITGRLEQEMEDKVIETTQTRDVRGEEELSDHEKETKNQQLNPKDNVLPNITTPSEPPQEASLSNRSTSAHEPNVAALNIPGKGSQNAASPSNSEERRERSSSPRRRYLDDRRHRDRSLSPRRHNSRWNSEERWHRDRRHRRNFRYQDNSRGRRDGSSRIQNENQVIVVGNAGQTPIFQQQSNGFSGQTQVNAQINPSPSNEQVWNVQNNSQFNQFNQMWQYYYYNQQQQQQQQLVPQQPPYQQTQPHQQNQQPMLNLQYLSQLPQFQQQQQQGSNEQPHSQEQQPQLQQQMQVPHQQLYLQMQQQQQQQPQQAVLHQDEMDPQKKQQQAYQYQQQYLLYLQQLQQYQYLQQHQPQPVEQQQELPAKQEGHESLRDEKSQSEPRHGDPRSGSHCQQGPEVEGSRTSISPVVASLPQDQLSELEELEI